MKEKIIEKIKIALGALFAALIMFFSYSINSRAPQLGMEVSIVLGVTLGICVSLFIFSVCFLVYGIAIIIINLTSALFRKKPF